jgi:polysaccharide export outer membrane protein
MNAASPTVIAALLNAALLNAAPPAGQTAGGSSPAPIVRPLPAPPANGGDAADYKLVAGDKLRVEVYKDPQLSQSLQVRPVGKITLPLVGDIMAAGQTPAALRQSIAASLKEYITNPVVTVIVVEAQPQTVSVMGEVNSPGTHALKGPTTVLEALAMAGGFKEFANSKKIVIRRGTPGGVQTIKFNYKDAIKAETKPMYLQPGDIIIVP